MWTLGINDSAGDLYDVVTSQYTSLAGISYPTGPAAWQPISLLNGYAAYGCATYGPAYFVSGNVVYLTGTMTFSSGFSGEIAVLPPPARPTHYLYMIAGNYIVDATTAADQYVALRIDPDSQVWIFSPPNGSTNLVSLSGLSFHTLS